jgi:8-oxo-dGTP diphosphatase
MMEPIDQARFVANNEVDELRWCSPRDAAALLTYNHDRRLVADLPA